MKLIPNFIIYKIKKISLIFKVYATETYMWIIDFAKLK